MCELGVCMCVPTTHPAGSLSEGSHQCRTITMRSREVGSRGVLEEAELGGENKRTGEKVQEKWRFGKNQVGRTREKQLERDGGKERL